jgi:hypothetical protein
MTFDDLCERDPGERIRRIDGAWRGQGSRDAAGRRPAFTTIEEIAQADALRLQLRARLLRAAPSVRPWSVGVE